MLINNIPVITNGKFAYDRCHKIYILENQADEDMMIEYDYTILPIEQLEETYNNSCSLKFIRNAQLTTIYAPQFEPAIFE